MTQTAKLFNSGRSQAVRLPKSFRFDGTEVYIRRDPESGDVVLSPRPGDWDGFLSALKAAKVPGEFLSREERQQGTHDRDPLDGISE